MSAPVVLFYTDNGIGLGHLTRQAAIAGRHRGAFHPSFLTMSVGYPLMRDLGVGAEYFPSYGALGVSKEQWEPIVAGRIQEALRLTGAGAIVVDHVSPPRIFERLSADNPGVTFVWSRRGLWQPGKNVAALNWTSGFDLIVEPGDLASPIDHGATAQRRGEAVATEPIVLVDKSETYGREDARDRLRIPRNRPAFLINVGDRDPDTVGDLIIRSRSAIESVVGRDAHFFAPLHPLHRDEMPAVERVSMSPVYPVSRYLNAFDGVVSMAGYNSFHEIVGSGLPAVFVPHRGARIDDQRRRAEFAALSGRAHWAPDVYDSSFHAAVKRMLRPEERDIAQRATAALGEMRGATQFAHILGEVAGSAGSGPGVRSSESEVWERGLGGEEAPGSRDVLVVALEHDGGQLADLVAGVPRSRGKLIVLIRDADPTPLYRSSVLFESVLTEAEWHDLGRADYDTYLEFRVVGLKNRYKVSRIIRAQPGQALDLDG